MSWASFLQAIGERQEHALTPHELDVILCLRQEPGQTKQDLLATYQNLHSPIEEEALTQRLRTIYRKFHITGRGHKLPQLHRHLHQEYLQSEQRFAAIGLRQIHAAVPDDRFASALSN